MMNHRRIGRAMSAALIAGSLGACDFITATDTNPNAVPSATLDQLFTGAQVNSFFFTENAISRVSAMWTQQAAGTDRQFSTLGTYIHNETTGDGEFSSIYTGGGLVDLRQAMTKAEEGGRRVYAGILKIHEAYLVGMGASIFGDLPYSEAIDPETREPALDKQEDVYAAVQSLLDEAIADLQSGEGAGPGGVDMNFGGDAASWIAVANTLKARYHLHWVEAQQAGVAAADVACGGDCAQKARDAAEQGIASSAGNWRTIHGDAATENNAWYQFLNDRSGYISAGAFGVNLLKDREDPRLEVFYTANGDGEFIGSEPGENLSTASSFNLGPTTPMDIVSCAEAQFIAAEASYHLGDAAGARAALEAGIACQESQHGVEIPEVDAASLSGQALFSEIMTQKYVALFLSTEVYNDYKRTCLPAFKTYEGEEVPRRLLYGQQERQSNTNIPEPNAQPLNNTNDPQGCTA